MAEKLVKIESIPKFLLDEANIGLRNFFIPVSAVVKAVKDKLQEEDPYGIREMPTVEAPDDKGSP